MFSFQVAETFVDAPINLISGIGDMQFLVRGGNLMLYAGTRAGGGVIALDIDSAMTVADSVMFNSTAKLPVPATLDMLTINGVPHLVVSGSNQPRLLAYRLDAAGAIDVAAKLTGSPGGVISAQSMVEMGGKTFFYAALSGEATISTYEMTVSGTMTLLDQDSLGPNLPGMDLTEMTTVRMGSQTYLVALSLQSDTVTTLAIGADGSLTKIGSIGASSGLGMADPTGVSAIAVGGKTFLVVASASSSSLSVLELRPDGGLLAVDHVIDTLDTRFQGTLTVTTATIGDRAFVITGGGDGGINLFMLLPNGRMVLVGEQLQLPGTALDNVTALAARVVGSEIDLFVAGEDAGITRLRLAPGDLAPMLQGGEANDILTGDARADLVVGGAGNDALYGGAGSDILSDGTGADSLFGGAGADIFVMSADGQLDVIGDFQLGIDRIDLSAWGRVYDAGELVITPTLGGCLVSFRGAQLQILSANGLPLSAAQFQNKDFFPLWHDLPSIVGSDGRIYGTDGSDFIAGSDGDDRISGSDGADTVDGGTGFDSIDYAQVARGLTIRMMAPGAILPADRSQVLCGIESVSGTVFADSIFGHVTADLLMGNAGNDTLSGGDGNDTLNGGAGADRLDGGAGRDLVSHAGAASGMWLDLGNQAANTGQAAGDVWTGIEDVAGSGFNDTVVGDNLDNQLLGMAGNDVLVGLAGNDTLLGCDGDDTLMGGAGVDRIEGGAGRDLVSHSGSSAGLWLDLVNQAANTGQAAGDVWTGIEDIAGSNFADTILGDTTDNQLFGLGGADILVGMAGNDMLSGGDGNDTLIGGPGADRIDGGAGRDLVSYSGSSTGLWLDLTNQAASTGQAAGDIWTTIEDIAGSNLADTILGDAVDNQLFGLGGADILVGMAGNDTLSGGDGNDTLIGGPGADRIEGGAGRDMVSHSGSAVGLWLDLTNQAANTGQAIGDVWVGVEDIAGTNLNDTILGDAQDNLLMGMNGNDILRGGLGNDTLTGGLGADDFHFQSGRDVISDFANDIDTIVLDSALWGGGSRSLDDILNPANTVITADGVQLIFSDAHQLLIQGLTAVDQLLDDILIL